MQCLVSGPLLRRQRRDEGILDRLHAECPFQLRRRPGDQHFPGIHRDQPVKAFGFFHVGGCDNHAHAGAACTHPIDQFPELAA